MLLRRQLGGGLGRSDYAAANAWLDAFATASRRDSPWPVFSVNWDAWRDVGVGAGMDVPEGMGLDERTGMEVFDRVVNGPPQPQTLVSVTPLAQRLRPLDGLVDALEAAPQPAAPSGGAAHPRPVLSTPYRAPEGELEDNLAALWTEALGIHGIGADDNLFELGGDSLLAIRLLARVRKAYAVDIHPAAFFKAPRIADLAQLVELRLIETSSAAPHLLPFPSRPIDMSDSPLLSERRARLSPRTAGAAAAAAGRPSRRCVRCRRAEPPPASAVDALPRSGVPEGPRPPVLGPAGPVVPLAHGPRQYGLPRGGGLDFEGPLDAAALHAALQTLVRRHEGLRTVFGEGGDGMPWQRVEPAREVPLPCTDLSGLAPAGRDARLEALAREVCAQPFDLRRGPLLRCALARLGPREHRLLFMMHHIASDAWTVERILDEWARGYADALEGRAPPDAPPALRYVDFAIWQRQWLQGPEAARHRDYWTRQLAEEAPVLQIGRGTAAPSPQAPEARDAGAAQHLLAVPARWRGRCASVPARTARRCSACCWRASMRCCSAMPGTPCSAWACPWRDATARRRPTWPASSSTPW